MVDSFPHIPGVITSEELTTGIPSQLSVAVAVPVLFGSLLSVHSIVISAGQLMTGGVESTTEMT
jgi:hypothetical protein